MKDLHKCTTPFCRNKKATNRTVCHKCKAHKYKQSHPIEYAYANLRANAKRRGKEFNLSLSDFRNFVISTGYLLNTGKDADSLTIDRIDNTKGYEIGNIEILTRGQNSHKRMTKDMFINPDGSRSFRNRIYTYQIDFSNQAPF